MSPERAAEQLSQLAGGRGDQAAWAAALKQAKGASTLDSGWFPVLTRVPLFQSLSKRHLRRVARLAELKRYRQGAEIVREGSRGDSLYVILDGTATLKTAAGHVQTLQPGDYFGELALLDGAPRSATVTTIGPVATAKIKRADFLRLLKEEPVIGVGLSNGLVALVRQLQQE